MEKYYLPIDGKNLTFDVPSIELLFGCGGAVSDCYDHETMKYAFYNTGHLCQVSYEKGSQCMKVEVLTGCDSRKWDILQWLKKYLTNGMAEGNIGVDYFDFDGYFYARFYEKDNGLL